MPRTIASASSAAWSRRCFSISLNLDRRCTTFDPKDPDHANFAEMVKAMDAVVEIKKGQTDHMLRVR